MTISEKEAKLAVEASEAADVLRAIHTGLAELLPLYHRLTAIHSGSPETTLSMRKVQEAQFWLKEHGHEGWIES
jgi:hypothetical protein